MATMLLLSLLATASAVRLASQATILQAYTTGCADGQREGFVDATRFPTVAGCNGAWTVPGISNFAPQVAPSCAPYKPHDTRYPTCNRQAGDDSPTHSNGTGCSAEDLCADGWHVCLSAADFGQTKALCTQANPIGSPPQLWLSRQSSTGFQKCATGTSTSSNCNSVSGEVGCLQTELISNDVFGCGNYGATLAGKTCGNFNRFSDNLCSAIASFGWSCNPTGTENGLCETYTIVHNNPATGGVLCCRDTICLDADGDKVCDRTDNCISTPNADQANKDGDGSGDACDPCPEDPKVDASNFDKDKGCPAQGGGIVVPPKDTDGDGIPDESDNCPTVPNKDQKDCDKDGVGSACDYCPFNKNIQTGGPGVKC